MVLSPLEQFQVNPLLSVTIFGTQRSITNLTFYTLVAIAVVILPLRSRTRVVPTRFSILPEAFQATRSNRTAEQLGAGQTRYLPFLGAVFSFILATNLLGNIPYGFAVGTSLALARGFSLTVWIGVTVLSLSLYRRHFFSFFVPAGCPTGLVPALSLIELISYFARAISLGVRLLANLVSGHALLKVISGFLYAGLTGPLAAVLCALPRALFCALVGLEVAVSFIQAYVFTVLTAIYLNDALRLHLYTNRLAQLVEPLSYTECESCVRVAYWLTIILPFHSLSSVVKKEGHVT